MGPWLRRRALLLAVVGAVAVLVLLSLPPYSPPIPRIDLPGPPLDDAGGLVAALLAVPLLTFLGWAIFGNGALLLIGITRFFRFRRASLELGLKVQWTLRGPRCRGRIGDIWVDVGQDGRPCVFGGGSYIPEEARFPDGVALFDSRTAASLDQERAEVVNGGLRIKRTPTTVAGIVEVTQAGVRLTAGLVERARRPLGPRLAEIFRSDPDPARRLRALKALLQLNLAETPGVRERALRSPSPEIRLAAALNPLEPETLEALVRDPDAPEEVRAKAGEALASLRRHEGIEAGNLSIAAGGREGGVSLAPAQGSRVLVASPRSQGNG